MLFYVTVQVACWAGGMLRMSYVSCMLRMSYVSCVPSPTLYVAHVVCAALAPAT